MPAACGILKAEVGAMHTKEQLLALLENHRGQFFSGEEIARRLELSRTAVWKAVKTLRAEGYPIEAVQNRGYCLSAESDVLSAQGVAKYLGPACAGLTLEVLPTVGSTNEAARARAIAGAPEQIRAAAEGAPVTATLGGREVKLLLDITPRQRDILLAGGLLNYIRDGGV